MIIEIWTSTCPENRSLSHVFKTDHLAGADVLSFVRSVIEIVERDQEALERNANALGRTTQHKFVKSIGTIPIDQE